MARAIPLDPDTRRAQLLDASRQVFAERGYHRASVSDIITAAGVARGTFYNYFESKRAVFRALTRLPADRDPAAIVAGAVVHVTAVAPDARRE